MPWSKVREHTFDNLIALCPTCHARYDRGEIDRQSMLSYKANLGVLTSRYGELEQRVLKVLADAPPDSSVVIAGNMIILVMYLLEDELIQEKSMGASVKIQGIEANRAFSLTEKGREFVDRWYAAEEIR